MRTRGTKTARPWLWRGAAGIFVLILLELPFILYATGFGAKGMLASLGITGLGEAACCRFWRPCSCQVRCAVVAPGCIAGLVG